MQFDTGWDPNEKREVTRTSFVVSRRQWFARDSVTDTGYQSVVRETMADALLTPLVLDNIYPTKNIPYGSKHIQQMHVNFNVDIPVDIEQWN